MRRRKKENRKEEEEEKKKNKKKKEEEEEEQQQQQQQQQRPCPLHVHTKLPLPFTTHSNNDANVSPQTGVVDLSFSPTISSITPCVSL